MSADIIPLTVRVSDGSVAPEPLTPKRTAASRDEILAGLSVKERMLIYAIVASLEEIAKMPHSESLAVRLGAAAPLLQAFQDATGVDYVGSAWDE